MLDGSAIGPALTVADVDQDVLPRVVVTDRAPVGGERSKDHVLGRGAPHRVGFISARRSFGVVRRPRRRARTRLAAGSAGLVATTDELLLAGRPPDRQRFLAGVAQLTIYLHDIGIPVATPMARRSTCWSQPRFPIRSRRTTSSTGSSTTEGSSSVGWRLSTPWPDSTCRST